MTRGCFLLVFAASGAAALVYEVTWTRLLTLQLGHSVAGASTVLAAFMGGMAAGAAAGGRLGDRLAARLALQTYAGLEVAIALSAVLLPLGLDAFTPLFERAYANGDGGTLFWGLRLVSTLMLLAVPAAAMGATFPVASRWFVRRAARAAGEAGALYAANTIGAALGAVAAGFVLLPALGLRGTTWVGVALNILAAATALWLARHPEPAPDAPPQTEARSRRRKPAAPPPTAATARRQMRLPPAVIAALALGVSGFASLSLQVVWTRLLAMLLGPTTYAFSIIVATFIAGIALGSAIASRLAPRLARPGVALVTTLFLSALLALVAAGLVDSSLLTMAAVVAAPDATFTGVTIRQAALVGGLLAPMTISFGAAFPLAIAVATGRDDRIARDLGLVYTVNTAGAIAGSLVTGFLLLPWLGLHGTVRAVAAAATVAGLVLLVMTRPSGMSRPVAIAAALAATGAVVWMPPWNPLLLSSGAYKYAPQLQGPDLETALTAGVLEYYREGASGTVAVRRLTGNVSLAIDGKVDASNGGDMLTQRLLAHVPLLLHPAPKRVAVLGMGSGVTAGSALVHPVDNVTVLEISPEVVEASRFFATENHHVLEDPRTRLILGDGRTHLLLASEQYDVIVSEPSNPWMAGIASLFTQEFFQAAKARLAPGGILCQWAHTYDISRADLQSIVATFLSVFPDGTLWLIGEGDVLLVGSDGPLAPRLAGVAEAWRRPGVSGDLASVGALDPFAVLSSYVAGGEALRAWADGAPLQTDDRARLEFSGPRSIFGRARDDNYTALRDLADRTPPPPVIASALASATPDVWRDRGRMLVQADAFRPAYNDFVRALHAAPDDARTLGGLVRAAAPLNRDREARDLLTELASVPGRTAARLELSRLLAAEGAYEEAVRIPLGILEEEPGHVAALEQLASIFADLNDQERLAPVVARLQMERPDSDAALYYNAALLFMQGHLERAAGQAAVVAGRNPSHARAQNLLGACMASLGRPDAARQAFEASLAANPLDPTTYTNLGTLELQAGNPDLAARHFAEALTVDPSSASARQGLMEVRR